MIRASLKTILVALALCLPAGHAAEAARAREVMVTIDWSPPTAITRAGTLDLRGNKTLQLGTATPRHVFRLEGDAALTDGKVFIP